jgi:hypothetical protein
VGRAKEAGRTGGGADLRELGVGGGLDGEEGGDKKGFVERVLFRKRTPVFLYSREKGYVEEAEAQISLGWRRSLVGFRVEEAEAQISLVWRRRLVQSGGID